MVIQKYIHKILSRFSKSKEYTHRILFPTLPLEYRAKHCADLEKEIAYRWAKLKKINTQI